MIVWDTGTYENLTEKDGQPVDVADAIVAGHVNGVIAEPRRTRGVRRRFGGVATTGARSWG